MNLEEIINEWEEDSQIDGARIVDESIRSTKLHAKYYRVFLKEKIKLIKFESELNKLMLLKYDYFDGSMDKATLEEHGWKQFDKHVLKTQIQKYIDADEDVMNEKLKTNIQKEKVALLKDIINSINQRTFHIKNIIEAKKFENGVY